MILMSLMRCVELSNRILGEKILGLKGGFKKLKNQKQFLQIILFNHRIMSTTKL